MSDVAVAPDRPAAAPPRVTGAARPLKRRSTLPSGRAVVGGFLIALSALGIFAAYSRATAGPTTSYVVARSDIPVGTRLTADDLTLLPMDLPPVVAGSAVFASEEPLVGATTVGPIRRGEIVQTGDVVKKRSGAEELEISFAIDSSRALAGTLRPGEEVLRTAWDRAPDDGETDPYWRVLVEVNRDVLADPENADLLFPGQVLEVPPPPPRPLPPG
jgi:flagella basal body P-ring formation protein FlgA